MSKKHRLTNYTNFSKERNDVPVVEAGPAEVADEEPVVVVSPVTIPEEEPEIPLPEKANSRRGLVFNCEMVNVRQTPNPEANVVAIISNGEELDVYEEENGFYKVITSLMISGYINKNYVSIR